MSRTFPRAAGTRPGKFVSFMTLIAIAGDTEQLSKNESRILAQRIPNAKSLGSGFLCKTLARRDCSCGNISPEKRMRAEQVPPSESLRLIGLSGCRGCRLLLGRSRFFAFPANADDFGNTGLLHGYPIEHASSLHCFAVVGDHDELGLRTHFANQASEASDVCLVERSIDFVQDTERTRLVAENGDQQRQRGHGFFSA